jgi:hypothetical protein
MTQSVAVQPARTIWLWREFCGDPAHSTYWPFTGTSRGTIKASIK